MGLTEGGYNSIKFNQTKKQEKYPRYPPFNSGMCGGSRGRNRCFGTCARYKSLIISYQQKLQDWDYI